MNWTGAQKMRSKLGSHLSQKDQEKYFVSPGLLIFYKAYSLVELREFENVHTKCVLNHNRSDGPDRRDGRTDRWALYDRVRQLRAAECRHLPGRAGRDRAQAVSSRTGGGLGRILLTRRPVGGLHVHTERIRGHLSRASG